MEKMITQEFKKDFYLCIKHWEVSGEELEFEKNRVRKNYLEAERCYASIAGKLRNGSFIEKVIDK